MKKTKFLFLFVAMAAVLSTSCDDFWTYYKYVKRGTSEVTVNEAVGAGEKLAVAPGVVDGDIAPYYRVEINYTVNGTAGMLHLYDFGDDYLENEYSYTENFIKNEGSIGLFWYDRAGYGKKITDLASADDVVIIEKVKYYFYDYIDVTGHGSESQNDD